MGRCAGSNVVFDMAIFVGEALIAQCPKLYWDDFPDAFPYITDVAQRKSHIRFVTWLKKDRGSGFQRPTVTGFRNPLTSWDPFLDMGNYASKLVSFETIDKLIADKRRTSSKLWRFHTTEIARAFDGFINWYQSKTISAGLIARDGY